MVEDFKNKKELIMAYKVGNISRELLEALAFENNWQIKGIENMPKNYLDKGFQLIITCRFKKAENGKLYCRTHTQSLLYKFTDKLICCCGEDELISKYGNKKYYDFMNNNGEFSC